MSLPRDVNGIIEYLYAVGLPVGLIASKVQLTKGATKSRIRHRGYKRYPDLYAKGVELMALEGETFRELSYAPGYWVSDQGRVLAMKGAPGCVLKPEVDKDGYLRACIEVFDGSRKHKQVHRMVADAFIGEKPEGKNLAHGNGIRSDNRVDNLRWATQAENCADKIEHGTQTRGSSHHRSRHTEEQVRLAKEARHNGMTLRQASEYSGVSFSTVASACTGKTWRHV